MPNRSRQHGFTIIELIVTLSILGLMLFLVNELFNNTSRAVTTSVQVSKTIAQSRSINEQLTQDADAMVGPSASGNGGYIVILQQRIRGNRTNANANPNARLRDPQTLAEIVVDQVRTDQIVFIRRAEELRSMTPASAGGFDSNFVGFPGDAAKVYYGQAIRTDLDGSSTNEQLGGPDAGFDRIASDFILARQALLFDPTDVAAMPNQKLSDDTAGFTFAANAFIDAGVTVDGGFGPGGALAYLGLSDMTVQSYGNLVANLNDSLTANPPNPAADNVDYLNTMYGMDNLASSPTRRLHVNAAPNPEETDFASWAIAQSHPILAQSCSEVIIDFAADLDGDGNIDTQFGGQSTNTNAPIHWYDGLTQPNLGTTVPGQWTQQQRLVTPITPMGPGTPTVVDLPQPTIVVNANTRAFIFRVDDAIAFDGPTGAGGTLGTPGTAHSYWPYMIRIRYRLHDTRGRLTSNYRAALRDGLDNDGDNQRDTFANPGADQDEERISGRWFERIIRVPRP